MKNMSKNFKDVNFLNFVFDLVFIIAMFYVFIFSIKFLEYLIFSISCEDNNGYLSTYSYDLKTCDLKK